MYRVLDVSSGPAGFGLSRLHLSAEKLITVYLKSIPNDFCKPITGITREQQGPSIIIEKSRSASISPCVPMQMYRQDCSGNSVIRRPQGVVQSANAWLVCAIKYLQRIGILPNVTLQKNVLCAPAKKGSNKPVQ